MVIPVKVGLWSVLLIGCYCLWNFSKRDIVSKLFKFGRQIYLAFLLYLGLHILCTKLMVTGSRAQYQINGYQLRMSHCNQGTFLSSAGSYTMVSLTKKRILCTGRSPCGFCDYRLYLFVSVSDSCAFFLPALSLLPGERPAQDERCFSEGKWDMSRPISETRSSTTLVLKPGISLRSSRTFSYLDNSLYIRSDKSSTKV